MALPDSWVDHLFAKLSVRYGDAWARKWEGIQMSAVRADWADVLDGVSGSSIAYGLKNLPAEFPPNADAFRALCNGGPVNHPTVFALPPPASKTDVSEAAVARLKQIRNELVQRMSIGGRA